VEQGAWGMGQGVKAGALYSPCSELPAPCSRRMFFCIDVGGRLQQEFLATAKIRSQVVGGLGVGAGRNLSRVQGAGGKEVRRSRGRQREGSNAEAAAARDAPTSFS
jgi:hypothetical protein